LARVAFRADRRTVNLAEQNVRGITASGLGENDTRIINDALLPFYWRCLCIRLLNWRLPAPEKWIRQLKRYLRNLS
jgi:hypothetical protein